MELRSGRRLRSLPTPAPRHSLRPPGFSAGGGVDWISALPDDMLLQILVRLDCARAAALTSGLSRRWRGLWRYLPELSFMDVSPDALDAALDQVSCPALSLLEVDIPGMDRVMEPARVSSLLRAVARLAPANLAFSISGYCEDGDTHVEIPCFERATTVWLVVKNLFLTPPAGGAVFPLLERLSVVGCRFDTVELIPRCPRLRVLTFMYTGIGTLKIHSPTIEELEVSETIGGGRLSTIDIMAPLLKRLNLSLRRYEDEDYNVSFSAPMVENIRWEVWCERKIVGFGEKWRLYYLNLKMKESNCVLEMSISVPLQIPTPNAKRSFSQEIAPLPAFSVLVFSLIPGGHVFGALVSHLLGICSTIQSLKVTIGKFLGIESCSPHCSCDQPQNWRNEFISLTALEEVEVRGFGGIDHEVDFLKLLFRCATLMKRMTLVWEPEFLPTKDQRKEIYSIFKANPDVK